MASPQPPIRLRSRVSQPTSVGENEELWDALYVRQEGATIAPGFNRRRNSSFYCLGVGLILNQ